MVQKKIRQVYTVLPQTCEPISDDIVDACNDEQDSYDKGGSEQLRGAKLLTIKLNCHNSLRITNRDYTSPDSHKHHGGQAS